MVVKNYDIKTVRKIIGTAVTSLGLGAVPSNFKRWVTFVRTHDESDVRQYLYLISTTGEVYASTLSRASAAAKMKILLNPRDSVQVPQTGPTSPDFPLFSIAADKYLTCLTSQGDAEVEIQYYDEG